MRAMTGVRTNQTSSLSVPLSYPLYVHHAFPSLYVAEFVPYLAILSLPPSLYPVHPPLSLPSYPLSSSLSGITLVDATSPVDEPSDSDQVTEGVKFAYTLPYQQSKDSQDDTALVCVHTHACVSACVICILVCTYVSVCCREYGVYIVYAHVVGTQ